MKVFVYPTGGQGPEKLNPYIRNMKEAFSERFEVVEPSYKKRLPRMLVFFLNSFKADVYILNWVENSANHRWGLIGALLSMSGLIVVKIRQKKIVWIFHNIHPHGGETFWSKIFQRFLFKHSTIIVSHSQEATEYAKRYAKCQVFFKNHPIKKVDFREWNGILSDCDYYCWGRITPYKGIVEFISNPKCKESGRTIIIVGKCEDNSILNSIKDLSGDKILFEDRIPDFCEIAAQCKRAKYVVFPYIGDSISSSGALMDTLLMGGTPVGPNRGAFADLAKAGLCVTYNTLEEVYSLPVDEEHRIVIDKDKVVSFVKENSWEAFGQWLYDWVNEKH